MVGNSSSLTKHLQTLRLSLNVVKREAPNYQRLLGDDDLLLRVERVCDEAESLILQHKHNSNSNNPFKWLSRRRLTKKIKKLNCEICYISGILVSRSLVHMQQPPSTFGERGQEGTDQGSSSSDSTWSN